MSMLCTCDYGKCLVHPAKCQVCSKPVVVGNICAKCAGRIAR